METKNGNLKGNLSGSSNGNLSGSSNGNTFDIFGTEPIEIETYNKEKEKRDGVFYSPNANAAPDGIYEAKIRFLYNPRNPVKSIIHKVVYYLKDEKTGQGYYFDSPISIGDWNSCEIFQLWKRLSKSENAIDRKNAEKIQKKDVYYSLVYIIDDKVNPEYNGKIKIFRYGVKIKSKLDWFLNPKSGKKIDVFNFFTGRNLNLYITRVAGYNNYDQTMFDNESSPIVINGIEVQPTPEGRELLKKFMENAPVLEQVEYKPLTEEQRIQLHAILNQYRPMGEKSEIINTTIDTSLSSPVEIKKVENNNTIINTDLDDENLEEFLKDLGI